MDGIQQITRIINTQRFKHETRYIIKPAIICISRSVCFSCLKMYKILAKINKIILPSLTRRRVDIYKLTKLQKILLAYRCFVTKKSLK